MFDDYEKLIAKGLDAVTYSQSTKIKSTQYLYGCDAKEWRDKPYNVALKTKIDKANKLLGELLDEHTKLLSSKKWDKEYMSYLSHRIKHVHDAIKFNNLLIDEVTD